MKKTGQFILYLLILIVAAKAIYYYGFTPLTTAAPPPFVANYQGHKFGLYAHIFAAVLALLLGPLQFWTRLRLQYRQLHRLMGRAYLGLGVLVGGLSGLYMSQFAFGGPAVKFGFAALAVAWLYTGFKAYQSIRAGEIAQHRAWMVRNFSLTLAAVSLRVYLPLSMMAGVQFGTAYAIIAWLCWVPNLLLAELVWNRGRNGQPAVALQSPIDASTV
jgi:uncharacterized membrane protein